MVSRNRGTSAVRVVRVLDELEDLREFWVLSGGHRDSNMDFYIEFVRSTPEVIRPHVVVLSRGDQLAAILIGRLERIRLNCKIGYLKLPALTVDCLTFVYGGLRGETSEENSRELVASVMNSLRDGEADMAFFHHPDLNSHLSQFARKLPAFASRDHIPQTALHYFMRLPDSIETVYLGLSSDHRSELRRKAKKLKGAFGDQVCVRCFRDAGELDTVIPQIEAIAKRTYQRGLGVGFEDTPLVRRRLYFFASKGWLRVYVLYLGEHPSSFWIGTVSDEMFCSDYLAFDPKFGGHSPGTVLLTRVVEELCKEGVKQIDFGLGEGRYKERFGNIKSVDASIYILAPTRRGIAINTLRSGTMVMDIVLKKIISRMGMAQKVKKLWRT